MTKAVHNSNAAGERATLLTGTMERFLVGKSGEESCSFESQPARRT